MSRHSAIALLTSMAETAQPGRDALRDRMAGTVDPDIGAGAEQSTATLAQQIVAAGAKRRGEKV
jgi:hypothetical protein